MAAAHSGILSVTGLTRRLLGLLLGTGKKQPRPQNLLVFLSCRCYSDMGIPSSYCLSDLG